MKKMIIRWGLATTVLLALSPAYANLQLAQKNQCMTCHTVATKVLGPAYQDVAKKYKDSKDAEAALAASIKKGSAGKWGTIPMPAQPNVSDADTKVLAMWILGLSK